MTDTFSFLGSNAGAFFSEYLVISDEEHPRRERKKTTMQASDESGIVAAAVQSLSTAFLSCGLKPGLPFLIHSSLSSFGHIPGGADTLLDALLLALGPEGTLCVPTLSYLFVSEKQPSFDVRSTPSNLGIIPHTFLRRAGVLRSLHPTHSVAALGVQAEVITGQHGLDRSPVGAHSPFSKVRELGGQVAFLGCGMRCNTSIHGVEELLLPSPPPYLLLPSPITYSLTDSKGLTQQVQHRRHNFAGVAQRYERLAAMLQPGVSYWHGRVQQAEVHIMDAKAMWAAALAALEADVGCLTEQCAQGSEEDHHLVADSSATSWRYRVAPALAAQQA